jgi:NIMA-interacting peptidyl-prolyl cis-trans isomerase 1
MEDDTPVDVAAVADAVEAAASSAVAETTDNNTHDNEDDQHQEQQEQKSEDPPPPLPRGWVIKECRSSPEFYYYYNMDTGISTWDHPSNIENAEQVADRLLGAVGAVASRRHVTDDDEDYAAREGNDDDQRSSKRQKIGGTTNSSSAGDTTMMDSTSSSSKEGEVRVLHILKKHKGSRRPASWRNPKITSTREEAHEELEGLLEILKEEESDLTELRATFEELARTESDCSSAKRGGDLGFFGRKKMQPAFEKESFNLKIGELTTNIVDTKSGCHILLRIG